MQLSSHVLLAFNSPTSLLSVSVLQCCMTENYPATFLEGHHWYREPGHYGSVLTTMGVTSYYTITVHLTTADPLNSGYILATQMSSVLMDVLVSSVEDAVQT